MCHFITCTLGLRAPLVLLPLMCHWISPKFLSLLTTYLVLKIL